MQRNCNIKRIRSAASQTHSNRVSYAKTHFPAISKLNNQFTTHNLPLLGVMRAFQSRGRAISANKASICILEGKNETSQLAHALLFKFCKNAKDAPLFTFLFVFLSFLNSPSRQSPDLLLFLFVSARSVGDQHFTHEVWQDVCHAISLHHAHGHGRQRSSRIAQVQRHKLAPAH